MNYSSAEIWGIIAALGLGTFLIRFSFLGLIGGRKMPPWVLRHLRYTSVAILPGLVAPLVLWPASEGGEVSVTWLATAAVTVSVGYLTKGVVIAMLCGAAVFYGFGYALG